MSGLIGPRDGSRRRLRVAVLFERFGPYHVARLDAAAARLDVVGIEMTRMDATYAWASTEGEGAFDRRVICDEPDADPGERRFAKRLGAMLDEIAPDVVATPGWSHGLALSALGWCLRRGTPTVLMSESTALDAPRRRPVEAVKRRLVSLYDSALVGGGPQRDYLVTLGMRPDSIREGYDAVDNAYFEAGAMLARLEGDAARRRQGLPEGPYFFASSRFVPKKNLLALLGAYARYRAGAGLPWPLVLAGDGPMRAEIEARVEALGLEGAVILPGFLQYDVLPAHYGLAGAFILASTSEQWGLVVNEAMASGLPVLVSERCGCARDLVQEGVTGYLFDPADIEAIAASMRRISAAEVAREAMGQAANRRLAAWGTPRFADGLAAAAGIAVAASRRRGPLERALLRFVAGAI